MTSILKVTFICDLCGKKFVQEIPKFVNVIFQIVATQI
jgi:hypothetical protein